MKLNNLHFVCFIIFSCIIGISFSKSPSDIDLDALKKISIVDEGRIKPFDTYARILVKSLSGKKKIQGYSSIQILAEILFTPERADTLHLFLIDNRDLKDALELPWEKRRFSYLELYPKLTKLQEISQQFSTSNSEKGQFQKAASQLDNAINLYIQLTSFLSFNDQSEMFVISDTSLAESLGVAPMSAASFYFLKQNSALLSRMMKDLTPSQTDSTTHFQSTPFIELVQRMYSFQNSIGNPPPHIIPFDSSGSVKWLSPWGLVSISKFNASEDLIGSLLKAKLAYQNQDNREFTTALTNFNQRLLIDAPPQVSLKSHTIEIIYNAINPFSKAQILYGIAVIFGLILTFYKKNVFKVITITLLLLGIILQTYGITARSLITLRTPITNLYEVFVFVAWICAILGIVLHKINKDFPGMFIGALSGFIFLQGASRYGVNGDTIEVLVAVLSSNFWLSTHIMTIALGYAGVLAAGIAAHICLIQKFTSKKLSTPNQSFEIVRGLLGFGLIFTVFGTILGGMWADQAWGRFWGWDPKENGALLVIIWTSLTLHLYRSKIGGEFTFALATIFGNLVLLFCWLGVNMLGVGMHSYGFTSSGALWLFSISLFETLFIIFCIVWNFIISKKKLAA